MNRKETGKIRKRIIQTAAVVFFLFSIFSLSVFAQGQEDASAVLEEERANGWITECVGPPLVEEENADLESEQAPEWLESADIYAASDAEAGIAYLREELKKRTEGVIRFSYTDAEPLDKTEADAAMKALMAQVKAGIYLHTGNPCEGDYLKFQIAYTVSAGYSGYYGKLTYTAKVTPVYYDTAEEEAELDCAFAQAEEALALSGKSDYQKIKEIYDFICGSVTYDYEHLNQSAYKLKYTAYAALVNGTAVCQGYANLFYRMALSAGLDARIVCGDTNGDGKQDHAWNIVKLGTVYYNVDATWDAGKSSYSYFLKTDSSMKNHEKSDAYQTEEFLAAYPPASEDYSENRVTDSGYEGLAYDEESDCWLYVSNGRVDMDETGLTYYNGTWFYVSNGVLDWSYTGLTCYNGTWFYVSNGVLDWSYTGLTCYNGEWFYVSNGVLDWSYTGLTCYNGTWFYVSNGVLDWTYAGLACYNGAWFYVSEGAVDWTYTGLTCYNGIWFYVSGGVLDWGYTGLVLYKETWFYVSRGAIDWTYTGLTCYNGTWFYVSKGVLDWSYTGLTLYNGAWFYISKGVLDWTYTGLTLYSGTRFYVANGVLDWNYSGWAVDEGVRYPVKNGVAGYPETES